ncbi:hypothetical protein M406DRAFT_74178 [Cryphonectria parasitica EP155]|uniref:Uncharacterized protein n=1 Tax=Cryphonectria parasitica (strain ATCC 38755 / EP155) TaxID=660469 RepID=A0A9P5CLR3_CRYP1|nr:uncharacterized protein M406DRAFT_74178 [Cryphonectria parasitica EP155]KAF3763594.1 hypothetical protein M406DRAFT_74178 [Cryphonectria parasitica EP155]
MASQITLLLLFLLSVTGVVASPAPQPRPLMDLTIEDLPPPTEDGFPRPACTDLADCFPWASDQCKQAEESGLLVKAYCFEEYCYALCPPVFPTTWSDSEEDDDYEYYAADEAEGEERENAEWQQQQQQLEEEFLALTIPPFPLPTILPPGEEPTKTKTHKSKTSKSHKFKGSKTPQSTPVESVKPTEVTLTVSSIIITRSDVAGPVTVGDEMMESESIEPTSATLTVSRIILPKPPVTGLATVENEADSSSDPVPAIE